MWPGPYVPAFTLVLDQRRVHRLTFGIDYAAPIPSSQWQVYEQTAGSVHARVRCSRLAACSIR